MPATPAGPARSFPPAAREGMRADRLAAEAEPLSRVLPLTIFAAGKERFEAIIRGACNATEAKILVFRHLPLEENGWIRCDAKVRHLRNEAQGMVFLVERG